MNKYFLFLLCLGSCFKVSSQKIIISGEEKNRPLQWSDFKGAPDPNSSFFANTYWHMAFKNNGVVFKSDTAVLKGFEIVLTLDPVRSWVQPEKETAELLKHEQGHFDIAVICQQEIIKTVNSTVFFKSDAQSKLNGLFNSILDKYKLMEKKYDEETNHSIDADQQEKWNRFIKDELSKLAGAR